MKITETTPKVERTFTLELTEAELATIVIAFGTTTDAERRSIAVEAGISILTDSDAFGLYHDLFAVIKND